MEPNIFQELVLKVHGFKKEPEQGSKNPKGFTQGMTDEMALYYVCQFAMLSATGFPVSAGVDVEATDNGFKVTFPEYDFLRGVSDFDMEEVVYRITTYDKWPQCTLTRGKYPRLHGNNFTLFLSHKLPE